MTLKEKIDQLFREYRKRIGKAPDDLKSYTYSGVTYEHFYAGYMAAIGYADCVPAPEVDGEDLLG